MHYFPNNQVINMQHSNTTSDLYTIIGRLTVQTQRLESSVSALRAELSENASYITYLEYRLQERGPQDMLPVRQACWPPSNPYEVDEQQEVCNLPVRQACWPPSNPYEVDDQQEVCNLPVRQACWPPSNPYDEQPQHLPAGYRRDNCVWPLADTGFDSPPPPLERQVADARLQDDTFRTPSEYVPEG
jgi:hypothetical protein